MCSGYFGLCLATQNGEREHMLRTVLATVGAVLAAAAAMTPAAVASPTPPPSATPAAVSPAATGPAIGGAQLSGHGVLVNYPSGSVPRLPKIKASAWVIADAGTGQVLAAKDGVTLIVTLLHCPALTEIDAGKSLLNWGFAVDGKVRPVGTLVGALKPPALDRTALGGPPVLRPLSPRA